MGEVSTTNETAYIHISCQVSEFLPVEKIKEFQGNFKKRTKKEIEQIIVSILKFGFSFPFFIWKDGDNYWCLDGHGRILALLEMSKKHYFLDKEGKLCSDNAPVPSFPGLPVVYIEAADEGEAKQKMLRLNSQYGVIDIEGFRAFIEGLNIEWGDLALPNGGLIQIPEMFPNDKDRRSLVERFIVPPLSVFRVSSGYWQDRKKAWLSLGIKSEKGRNDGMLKNMASLAKKASGSTLPSESIFDPVLCEIMYRWFCPTGGVILDPFAGGSVRGIIAACLDYQYTGIDLRQEQIEANREQLHITKDRKPTWLQGDSRNMDALLPQDYSADLVFSCPPYADLEVYSKQPEDLSNMTYSDFQAAYFEIIKKACARLREDCFAVFVVGEARDKTRSGAYYGIVPDTIRAFEAAGVNFYNEMILVTQIAAKALTVAEGFVKSRKIGKIHQNILVFCKGDPVRAAEKCKIEQQEFIDALSEAEKAEAEELAHE
jgi:DNA modification methylase